MSAEDNRKVVERFYNVMWNCWDEDEMRAILDPEVDFHGSIGLHVTGHNGFAGYMRTIREAFQDFHNRIDDLVVTGDRAVARLTYTGTHDGVLFGHPASGRPIEYTGVAMFTIVDGRITRVWVLGDRMALMEQIGGREEPAT